ADCFTHRFADCFTHRFAVGFAHRFVIRFTIRVFGRTRGDDSPGTFAPVGFPRRVHGAVDVRARRTIAPRGSEGASAEHRGRELVAVRVRGRRGENRAAAAEHGDVVRYRERLAQLVRDDD